MSPHLNFKRRFEPLAANATERASRPAMFTDAERRQILVEWNPSPTEYARDLCIHELFEAQVERTPQGVAVTYESSRLTYAELNEGANRLARRLRGMGVGRDVLVGLFVERSIDMVVGILGILKAGGAYVPLDPEYPADHLAFVMDDARISVVVTQRPLVGRLLLEGLRPFSVVEIPSADEDQEETNLPDAPDPESLAYVMYTSGSTGTPKGVMVTHRNLVNSTSARYVSYREPVEGFLLLPPFTFDASVAVIFWTLCTGGRLVLLASGAEREPSRIGQQILLHSVSHVLCVSSLYAYILEVATPEELASMRVAITGGEVCPPALVRRHREKAPHASLSNEYGPTECTVWSSVCDVSREPEDALAPIGRPIANTQMYILDGELQPMPIGVPGELHIGGDGVARGYLNRPDLTTARFIPNSFSTDPDARLYKTGDLARYRPDGNIEFLGRLDRQVKVRGVRIEPEEIEIVLARHRSVRSAVVVAEDDLRGGQRLVAYIEKAADVHVDAGDLRSFLKQKLPEFMVPAGFVFLDSLPRNASGKVDRRALPPWAHDQPKTAGESEPLRVLERQLLEVWEETLGARPAGLDDNFFEVGGHSLLAAELLGRMEGLTGMRLPLASLIEAPTIRQLANAFRAPQSTRVSSPLVPVQPFGSRSALFCVPGAGQTALHYAPLARHLGHDQPVYVLAEELAEGKGRPDYRVEDVAARYIGEIRTVQPRGPYVLAGNSFGGLIAFEIARQLQAGGQDVCLLVLFDTANPGSTMRRYRRLAVQLRDRALHDIRRLVSEPDKVTYLRHRLRPVTKFVTLWFWTLAQRSRHVKKPGLPRHPHDVDVDHGPRLAYLRYAPKLYPGHLTLFRALHGVKDPPDPLLGWGRLVGSVEVHEVPGEHMTMLREPHVRIVAKRLTACLTRSQHAEAALSLPS